MAVGGIAAVGAALWWIWKKYIDVEDEEDDVEAKPLVKEDKQEDIPNLPVPKKLMIKIYSEISESIEMVMMQLAKYEEQLSQSPSYTPEMVHQEIASKMEMMLNSVEETTYRNNNVTKEDATKAAEMLQNDRDFKRATYRIRTMFAMLNGQQPEAPDLPEFMTIELTKKVSEEVMNAASKILTEVIRAKKEELGITDSEEFKTRVEHDDELQKTIFEKYMSDLDVKRTEILEKYNMDKAILQIAMMTYQNDPDFQQAMIEISQKQQQAFADMGFAF